MFDRTHIVRLVVVLSGLVVIMVIAQAGRSAGEEKPRRAAGVRAIAG